MTFLLSVSYGAWLLSINHFPLRPPTGAFSAKSHGVSQAALDKQDFNLKRYEAHTINTGVNVQREAVRSTVLKCRHVFLNEKHSDGSTSDICGCNVFVISLPPENILQFCHEFWDLKRIGLAPTKAIRRSACELSLTNFVFLFLLSRH